VEVSRVVLQGGCHDMAVHFFTAARNVNTSRHNTPKNVDV